MKDLGIKKPNIGVAGLNPHAGEGGLFGNEEITEIIPAINEARKQEVKTVMQNSCGFSGVNAVLIINKY